MSGQVCETDEEPARKRERLFYWKCKRIGSRGCMSSNCRCFSARAPVLTLKRGSTLRVVGRDQGFVGMGMRGFEIREIWPRFCAEWIKLMIDAVALDDASAP